MPSSARLRSRPGGSAARASRPTSRKELREGLATWGPPAVGGSIFLVLYVLGNVDVIETTPALSIDAALLVGMVLFFPMRYARRLSPRGRVAAALLAVAWLAIVYYPIYRRIYPGERITSVDVTAPSVPLDLAVAGGGNPLEFVIDGHLLPAGPGNSRVARYSLTVEAKDVAPQSFSGEFKESWLRQRQGRRESVDIHRERSAETVLLQNPRDVDLRVTAMSVLGHAEDRLTLTVYRYALPPVWVTYALCAALLVAAVVYDRATGAAETAASLAVATGAALTGAYAFPTVSSPHPSFRELFGAAIVGALLGGPVGGLVAWLLGGRLPTRPTDLEPVDAERIEEPPARIASFAPGRRLALAALLCLFAAYGFLYFYSDGRKLLDVASGISWLRLLLPVAGTLASYALMALSYEGIAAAAGTPIGFLPMLRITFVSNTVNYIVSTGGLSGFAVRMFFFRQSAIPIGRAITISFVQGLLTNLALLGFLLMGFYFLLTDEALGVTTLASAAVLLSAFLLITALCVFLLVRPKLRRRFLLWSVETGHRVARRFLPAHRTPRRARLWRLQRNIDHGFEFLLAKWPRMLLPAVYIALDWVLTIGVLWACFWCVGERLPFPLATIGFAVAILTSMVSVVPGGIGIMEGSMTLVFVGLGVDREPTVIAVLLFRLAYYGVPFLVSLSFFRGMLRVARRQTDAGLHGSA